MKVASITEAAISQGLKLGVHSFAAATPLLDLLRGIRKRSAMLLISPSPLALLTFQALACVVDQLIHRKQS